jgi:predicted nucleic acid-binding protein
VTRVFWDTMLFIYLLENNADHFRQVKRLLERSYERGDALYTSCLAVGEVMAGPSRINARTRDVIERMGFQLLPFDDKCMETFGRLRNEFKIKAPDAIHLAAAGAAGMDLFLTGDKALLNKRPFVAGIQFIADFQHSPQ